MRLDLGGLSCSSSRPKLVLRSSLLVEYWTPIRGAGGNLTSNVALLRQAQDNWSAEDAN